MDSIPNESEPVFKPGAWLRITADNSVTVIVAESEMGQGPYTLMPMMVAEELEVSWENIVVERASVDPVYGYQMTGGSSSIRKGWSTLREAGAVAREILLLAAAKQLAVSYEECQAVNGQVKHINSGNFIPYGELLETASSIDIPSRIPLKNRQDFKIIGTPVFRKDIPEKINGQAQYGVDIRLPQQLFATVVHSPVLGGKVDTIDTSNIKSLNGIRDIFIINEGVAVVATDTWKAFSAARELKIQWKDLQNAKISTETLFSQIKNSAKTDITQTITKGQANESKNVGKQSHTSQYLQPFHAHMTMEPMNCTAHFKDNGELELWVPTQSPSAAYDIAKNLTQSKLERGLNKLEYKLLNKFDSSIMVNTTLLGGGFGRRLKQDYVAEAIQIAKHYNQPVQLVWSREEDIQHDYYHPMTYHLMEAQLDEQGLPVMWKHHIKGAGVSSFGAEHSYDIAKQSIRVSNLKKVIPKGPWRSVAPHYNVFSVEHFIDELAAKSKRNPIQLRLLLLKNAPRLKNVLTLAVARSSMQKNTDENIFYGSAIASTFGSHVAQILELEKKSDHQFHIRKVICAIDCGVVINPDIVKQQMEGSIIFAISAATKSAISIKNGQVEQHNFYDYPILRMNETPDIEVIIINSDEEPGGIGEPAVPPLAPALANAILAASGQATTELPIKSII